MALVVEGITDSPESAVAAVQKLINQENAIAIIGPRDIQPAGNPARYIPPGTKDVVRDAPRPAAYRTA